MNTQTSMIKGNPTKLLLSFAIPLMLGNIFQQSFILIDRVIVGHLIGANAFSSIGATSSISMVFTSLCLGIAIGSGIVVSQFFGANDEKGTATAIRNGIIITIACTLCISVLALAMTKPILILLDTPVSLWKNAINYMSVSMGGLIFVILYYIPFSILRSLGDAKSPIIFLAICSILNIVFDLIFVLIFHTGVGGTAVASLLAQGIAGILCFQYALKKYSYFDMAFREAKFDKTIAKQILKICIPMGFQYSLIYLSSSILQWVINGFGTSVIGAFTATSQIENLIQQPFTALGTAMATYTGQNIGAGQIERIKQGLFSALKICTMYAAFLFVIFWIFGKMIMNIFVSDTAIIENAVKGIHITSIFFIALGITQILRYLLNGAGDSSYSMTNGLLEIVCRLAFVFLLTNIPLIGQWGIWWTTALTWLCTAIFAFYRLASGKWKSKIIFNGGNHHGI
jgi:putative MATE family efflux protein